MRMASPKVSHSRSLCRFRHSSNQQKVTLGEASVSKRMKNAGRSGDVYENKEDRFQVPGVRCQDIWGWPGSLPSGITKKNEKCRSIRGYV